MNKRKILTLILIVVIVLFFDILTKVIFENQYFTIINGIVSIYSTHNTGAAFSMFSESTLFLTVFTFILLVCLTVYYFHAKNKDKLFLISVSMIISGALGNLIDRLFLGYVRDFVKLDFVDFAIFNVADSAITIGTILFFIYFIFIDKETALVKPKKFDNQSDKQEKQLNFTAKSQIDSSEIEQSETNTKDKEV